MPARRRQTARLIIFATGFALYCVNALFCAGALAAAPRLATEADARAERLSGEASVSEAPRGIWRLPADGRLFPQALRLEWYAADEQRWNAREVGGIVLQPRIEGLRYSPELQEFLHGRIRTDAAGWLRCKLWRQGDRLFLRVYERYHYSTHALVPSSAPPAPGA